MRSPKSVTVPLKLIAFVLFVLMLHQRTKAFNGSFNPDYNINSGQLLFWNKNNQIVYDLVKKTES